MAPLGPDVLERQRRITVDEYHRMIEAGILGEDEHVQLIDGTLVALTPQGRPHARVVQRLNRLLVRAVGDDLEVLTQLPLTLVGESEPAPDLAVHREPDPTAGAYRVRTIVPSVSRSRRRPSPASGSTSPPSSTDGRAAARPYSSSSPKKKR